MTSIKNFFYLRAQVACIALGISLLLSTTICSGQTTNTNSGKDFWFGYLYSTILQGSLNQVVNITSPTSTSGTINIPGIGYTKNFTVSPNVLTTVILPTTVIFDSTGIGNTAVHITSNDNISVFASIETDARSENTCIMPVPLLGNQYYIMDFTQNGQGTPDYTSEFMVVAQDCKDSVEIIPSQNLLDGHLLGQPFTVVLQPGQLYQAQSDSDLTNSTILSLNHSETAVFGGASMDYLSTPNCGGSGSTGNPLYEELFPINTWGENYVLLPSNNATDEFRILAETNNTTITIYGSATYTITLNAGQYYDTAISYTAPVYITASNPVSTGRFLVSQNCNLSNPPLGDPSFALVDATSQMLLNNISFYISDEKELSAPMDTNYLSIVTLTTDANSIFLDGLNVGNLFTPLGLGTPYSYTSLGINQGSHTLASKGGHFLAYETGFSTGVDANACDAGIYLKEINIAATSTSPTTCSGNDGTATATVNGIPPFIYSWSNGATTSTITGLTAGTYKVIVSDMDCVPHIDSATVYLLGAGFEPTVYIYPPSDSICPGNMATIAVSGGTSYSWNTGATTSSITITPLSTTIYTATIGNGPCSSVDTTITVTVKTVTGGPPTPSFKADTVCFGFGTAFTNTSNPLGGNGVTFYWDFYSNGYYEDSTDVNPQWLFPNPGTYRVHLREVNNGDCGGFKDDTVNVIVRDTAGTSAIQNTNIFGVCVGTPATFNNNSADFNDSVGANISMTYQWIFGDTARGSGDTILQNSLSYFSQPYTVTHTYSRAGTYTVTLSPYPPIPCHDTATIIITVNPSPVLSIHNNYVCGDSVVTFKDWDSASSSGGFYEVQIFNYGTQLTIPGYPGFSYTATTTMTFPADTGTYMIVFAAFNPSLCGAIDTSYVTLDTPNPGITGKDTICNGTSILLTATGGAPYLWSPGGQTTQSININPNTETVYNITVGTGVCLGTATHTVVVNPAPGGTLSSKTKCNNPVVTLTASGIGTTYVWSTGQTTTVDTIQVTPISQTNYSVTVTNSFGCSSTASISVSTTPIAGITPNDTICQGQSVLLTATGDVPYQWNANANNATTDTVTVAPSHTTFYSVVIGSGSCLVTKRDTVIVNPVPVATIKPKTKCNDATITLLASSGYTSYVWSNGLTTTVDSIEVTPSSKTTYSVTVTNSFGCSSMADTTITIHTPSLSGCCNKTIMLGDSAVLTESGSYVGSYQWVSPSGVICNSCPSVTVTPTVTTTYTIIGTDLAGCPISLDTVTIIVEPPCATLVIPNVFTPNFEGLSGIDNVFYIKTPPQISSWSIYIYDRWGKEIFKSTSPIQYWTGVTESGDAVPEGVYYYVINLTCENETYKKKGFVQLIR